MAKPKYYTLRKRGSGWQANLSRRVTGSKRIQINRSTKAEAEAEAERRLQTLTAYGADFLNFKPEELRAFGEACRELTEKGFKPTTITDAVRYFTKHNDPKAQKRTVEEVLEEFLESKKNAGLADLSIRDYRQKLTRFSGKFGKRYMHSVTPFDMERWLDSIHATNTTRKDYRRHLSIFCGFAVKRKYTKENTAAAISKVKIKRTLPSVLTPQEVRSLLFAAKNYQLGAMLPYFAIGCFCGLRPWEIRRTSWSNVDLERKEIYVSPEACKTSQDRYVTIPDNLMAWLEKCTSGGTRKGLIHFSRKEFVAVRKKANVADKWESDIMRHSAASHLYAWTQNATLVTSQMGHSLGVFMKHYKRAVTKTDGELYFQVMPTDKETNTLNLRKASSL